jgi:hypothetical protein
VPDKTVWKFDIVKWGHSTAQVAWESSDANTSQIIGARNSKPKKRRRPLENVFRTFLL